MLPAERLERILIRINENAYVTINELMLWFNVSKPTIMRDLTKLENQGLINKTHGGATSLYPKTKFEPTHSMKESHAIDKKHQIAKKAIQFIQPGETILIDSGSTTLLLAQQLVFFNDVTVITNDLKIAMTLSENENIDLVVLGGQKRKGVYSLIGSIPENILVNLYVDKVFIGADAIDFDKGITNSNLDEVNLKKIMLQISNKVILLADSSKFNHTAFARIGDLELVDYIVTDYEITEKSILDKLKEKKVSVHIAK